MKNYTSEKSDIIHSILNGEYDQELINNDKKMMLLHKLLSPSSLKGVEDLENEVTPIFKYIGPESWYNLINKKEQK